MSTPLWAVSSTSITQPRAVAALTAWKTKHGLQSDLWLLPSHCSFLKVKAATADASSILHVDARDLAPATPSAFPLSQLPDRLKRACSQVMDAAPAQLGALPFILDTDASKPHGIAWREATRTEFLDASLATDPGARALEALLFSPAVHTPKFLPLSGTHRLLNAQDTSNPYRIDLSLTHVDLVSGCALAPAFASCLTTIAAQFGYRSLKWLDVRDLGKNGLPVEMLSTPHSVIDEEEVDLIHVTQLEPSFQRRLLATVPRWVLQKCMTRPFVFAEGRWLARSQAHLTQFLTRKDLLLSEGCDPETQPLLWVMVYPGEPAEGKRLRRTRTVTHRFLNVQQLKFPTDTTDMDGGTTCVPRKRTVTLLR